MSDILFSTKSENDDTYIYLLLEHQSKPHPFMAFRLFKYMLNICDRYLVLNPKSKKLPLIYPMVFYNGTQKYNASRNLWNLFTDKDLAQQFWTGDYQLINVHEIPDDELKNSYGVGILEFFMKHIRDRDILRIWKEVGPLLPKIMIHLGPGFIKLFVHYTLTSIPADDTIELKKMLTEHLNEQDGEEIVISFAEHWAQKGMQEGLYKGREEGGEEGKEEGVRITALNMIRNGLDTMLVSRITGVPAQDILSWSKKRKK